MASLFFAGFFLKKMPVVRSCFFFLKILWFMILEPAFLHKFIYFLNFPWVTVTQVSARKISFRHSWCSLVRLLAYMM